MAQKPKLLTSSDVRRKHGMKKSNLNRLVAEGRIMPYFDPGIPGQGRLYTDKEILKYLKSRDPRGRRSPDPK